MSFNIFYGLNEVKTPFFKLWISNPHQKKKKKFFSFTLSTPVDPALLLFLRRRVDQARQRSARHLTGLRCCSLDPFRILSFFRAREVRSSGPDLLLSCDPFLLLLSPSQEAEPVHLPLFSPRLLVCTALPPLSLHDCGLAH
jgi:hypothetical protein